jgi:hypothetical protein
MFKPQRVSFEELCERLHAYEDKYGYSTIEFYRRYENGELGDDDLCKKSLHQRDYLDNATFPTNVERSIPRSGTGLRNPLARGRACSSNRMITSSPV